MYELGDFFKDLWQAFIKIPLVIRWIVFSGELILGAAAYIILTLAFEIRPSDSLFFSWILPSLFTWIPMVIYTWKRIER